MIFYYHEVHPSQPQFLNQIQSQYQLTHRTMASQDSVADLLWIRNNEFKSLATEYRDLKDFYINRPVWVKIIKLRVEICTFFILLFPNPVTNSIICFGSFKDWISSLVNTDYYLWKQCGIDLGKSWFHLLRGQIHHIHILNKHQGL